MNLYNKLTGLVLVAGICLTSCTKGTIDNHQYYYGTIDFSIAALPNSPEVDVYVNNDSIVSMTPGSSPLALYKGETSELHQVNVYRKGTKELLADTLIKLNKNEKVYLKVACSEPLGMSGFLQASTTVDPDSSRIQLYNGLPASIHQDDVDVDAVLCYDNESGQSVEAGVVWEHFERGKLHPLIATVVARSYYVIKFRNRATGEFLTDSFGADYCAWSTVPGKFSILSAVGYQMGAWYMFIVDWAEL